MGVAVTALKRTSLCIAHASGTAPLPPLDHAHETHVCSRYFPLCANKPHWSDSCIHYRCIEMPKGRGVRSSQVQTQTCIFILADPRQLVRKLSCVCKKWLNGQMTSHLNLLTRVMHLACQPTVLQVLEDRGSKAAGSQGARRRVRAHASTPHTLSQAPSHSWSGSDRASLARYNHHWPVIG
jgi:hypothetical protein